MAMFLIVLGAILAVSGLAAIVGGLPFLAVGFDNTLILSGTVGLTGGLLAVGLGSILAALDDLGSRIDQFARPTTATLKAAARPGTRLPAPPRPTPVSAQMPAAEYSAPPEIPAAGPVPEAALVNTVPPPARLQPETLRIPPLRAPEPEPEPEEEPEPITMAPAARPQPVELPPAAPEPRPQARFEAIPETRPAFGSETRRDARQDAKPDPRPEAKLAPRFEPRAEPKPAAKGESKFGLKFEPKPAAQRETAADLRTPLRSKPEAKTEPTPASNPDTKDEPVSEAALAKVDPFRAAWQKAWGQGWSPDAAPEAQPSPTPPPNGEPAAPVGPALPSVPGLQDPAASRILKAGVIGGMAYTLYADGSIEADLPVGLVRFASVQALRDHVERAESKDKDKDQAG